MFVNKELYTDWKNKLIHFVNSQKTRSLFLLKNTEETFFLIRLWLYTSVIKKNLIKSFYKPMSNEASKKKK